MIAVVTGASGFIGSHLVEALRYHGVPVRVVRRPGSRWRSSIADVDIHDVDLLDAEATQRSTVWDGATHCFHLAGSTTGRDDREFTRANVMPTAHIIGACAARGAGAPHVVFVSSQAAAGPATSPTHPVRDNDPPRPIEGYGRSKQAAEELVRASSGPWTIVRPAVVYGPRDRDLLLIFRSALSRLAIYAAPADQQIAIVHVHDLVQALLAAAQPAAIGHTFMVANDEPVTWRALYELVAAAGGQRLRSVQAPLGLVHAAATVVERFPTRGNAPLLNRHKVALSRPAWWLCDTSGIRTTLDWRPAVPLTRGIAETLQAYVEAGWLPRRHLRGAA